MLPISQAHWEVCPVGIELSTVCFLVFITPHLGLCLYQFMLNTIHVVLNHSISKVCSVTLILLNFASHLVYHS